MDQNGSFSSRPYSSNMNKYWIPHKDIHKKVIITHIQFYLGREATVRSYTKDGEDGFLITTPGACLTDEQIDDICIKSMEMWERQAAARMLASDGASPSSSTSPRAPLKRPLHQPVVIARANPRYSGGDGRSRRLSWHAHRSSSSTATPSHHSRHNHNHNHSYSRQQQYPQPAPYQPEQPQGSFQPPQHQQQQDPQQHQFYAQQEHYGHLSARSPPQHMAHPYHADWVPLSPTQDDGAPDGEMRY